jgi:hypothetical protein
VWHERGKGPKIPATSRNGETPGRMADALSSAIPVADALFLRRWRS